VVSEVQSICIKKRHLLLGFLVALSLVLTSASISAVFSQALSPPCKKIEESIQTRAKKDAEVDRFNFINADKKKKSINDVLGLYKDENTKHSCFQQDILWDIYEKEYDTYKYPSWIPLLFILLLGGVLGTVRNRSGGIKV
jgi:uncharacterized ion transporter superfamily protein YfcC